ncbi:MAG: DUF202 domain-containing protein [Capsulimonadales bacterium]|nr:DUF202 domain-containing protein [Capsulimonadales bacterium]
MEESTDDERVREHLANERTCLAWTRTGMATMGFGVVIARLRYLFPPSALTPPASGLFHASDIGLLFAGVGLLTVLLSVWHYLAVRKQIRNRNYRASPVLVFVFTGIVLALGLLTLRYLFESRRADGT